MNQTVPAIFENGVLRPLERLDLGEHERVVIVVQAGNVEKNQASDRRDPLEGIRCATGIPDLAEHFDDYRLGHRDA